MLGRVLSAWISGKGFQIMLQSTNLKCRPLGQTCQKENWYSFVNLYLQLKEYHLDLSLRTFTDWTSSTLIALVTTETQLQSLPYIETLVVILIILSTWCLATSMEKTPIRLSRSRRKIEDHGAGRTKWMIFWIWGPQVVISDFSILPYRSSSSLKVWSIK